MLLRSSLYTTLLKSVIPAWIAGIQATWMYLSLPSLALDTRFPAGMTNFLRNLCITMSAGASERVKLRAPFGYAQDRLCGEKIRLMKRDRVFTQSQRFGQGGKQNIAPNG
jgi:hypothetical protein